MREIKFRAWDKEEKEMLHFNNPEFNSEYNFLRFECEEKWQFFGELENIFKNCELMQYTGLNDKNGKDIYEGDVVKAFKPNSYLDGIYEVAWHLTKGRWYYKNQPRFKDLYQVGCLGNLTCEIIGNIYENPELVNNET